MSEDHTDPENPDSARGWEKLLWEFFDSIFRHLIPGCIAVYLYAPQLADKVMEATSFVGAFVFLGLAWVAGVILDVLSVNVVKYPLELLNSWPKTKSWAKKCHDECFSDLSWAAEQAGSTANRELHVSWRMSFAQKTMFRSISALAILHALFVYALFPLIVWAWPQLSGYIQPPNLSLHRQNMLFAVGVATLLCFYFIHRDLRRAEWERIVHTVEYKDGDSTLEGFVAYNAAVHGMRPGVLVVHQWMGLTDYEKRRAEMLARLGYVAFCADIYGKGVRPQNTQEAAALAAIYKGDRALLRLRVNAGLDALKKNELVDPKRIAAIGYCFGGTTVIELARSGAKLNGVVSFHGGLDSPAPADGKNINCKILALAGADDPFQKPEDLASFEKEMRDAKVDWQINFYGGAVHAFTQRNAGDDNSKGAAYNERADKRSWEDMKLFFAEIFK